MSEQTVVEVMLGNEVKDFNLKVYAEDKVYVVAINEKKILIGDGMVSHKVAHALYASIKEELSWPSDIKPADYIHEYTYLESIVDIHGVPTESTKQFDKMNRILSYIENWA